MKHFFRLFIILTVLFCSCGKKSGEDMVTIHTPGGDLHLCPLSDNAVRVRSESLSGVPELEELIYVGDTVKPDFKVRENSRSVRISLSGIAVEYDKAADRLVFTDRHGKVILKEIGRAVTAGAVSGVPCLDVTESFESPEGEYLFGTGQFQDGYLNVRGLTRRLTQVNTQISIPFILSSRGCAVLWNNYGLTDFNPAGNSIGLIPVSEDSEGDVVNATGTFGNRREMRFHADFSADFTLEEEGDYSLLLDVGQSMARRHFLKVDDEVLIDFSNTWLPPTASVITHLAAGSHHIFVSGVRGDSPELHWRKVDNSTVFHSPVAQRLDYTVFAGSADECIASYRNLTGQVPKMQDWMFGYIHCRERYSSSDDILANAAGFRANDIPLDVIVQDWQWWGKYGWNALRFDEDHYPDPKALTDSLHRDDVHLMLSVWSKIDRQSEAGKALDARGCYIDGTDWIDFLNPDAAGFYCRNFLDSLGRFGIDAWWFDATEPENDDLAGRLIGKDGIPGEFYRNAYPLLVNRTMYGGLKSLSSEEPVILTRSAFPGIQRYGAVTWSGDVGNDFGTLRRQIVGGLGQMASGLPWWTFDAGGFFRPGNQYTDAGYQERLIRWVQVAVFLPFMRIHGYMSQTEPWRYSPETLDIIRECIKFRKSLQPYVIECAREVSEKGGTLMRPLVFDFPDDDLALAQETEYMFGSRYLVCPVLEAGVESMEVYLPRTPGGWKDIRNGESYKGGQLVTVPVTLESIPVFERRK